MNICHMSFFISHLTLIGIGKSLIVDQISHLNNEK